MCVHLETYFCEEDSRLSSCPVSIPFMAQVGQNEEGPDPSGLGPLWQTCPSKVVLNALRALCGDALTERRRSPCGLWVLEKRKGLTVILERGGREGPGRISLARCAWKQAAGRSFQVGVTDHFEKVMKVRDFLPPKCTYRPKFD